MENKLAELEAIQIEVLGTINNMNVDIEKFIGKRNNAAIRRVRIKSVLIRDYMKKLRKLSLELEKEGHK
jgi:hypothetical protein